MDAYVHEGFEEAALDRRIAEVADRFHGVVDVDQLRAVGASRTQIGVRLESGRLIRLHRGVYAVGHRRLTPRGWWLAAVRAIGAGAVLSHAHGAALRNLRPPPGGRINVTVLSRGRRQRKGIRVHATLDLPPEHVTEHDGIPVTTVERTLVDLAGMLDVPALARALEEAEKQQLLDVPALLAVSAGRPGAPRIRELLTDELPHTRSDLEAAFVALCDRYALPRPVMNAQVHGYEVDAYWPEQQLVVELDSWRHHGTRAAFERDRERDADLHARGIATVRFTYEQVMRRDRWTAGKLRAASRFRRGSSSSRRSAA
jgi:very-short-patch-repair endonuclease